MKRKFLGILLGLALLLACLPLCVGASALSPGLAVLANDLSLEKCGLVGNDMVFCAEDFDTMTGSYTESITVLTLPQSESGTLYLSDQPLERFTEILRSDIDKLSFRSVCDKEHAASFSFRQQSSEGRYQAVCHLYMLDRLNFAPTVSLTDNGEAVTCSAYAGIMTIGELRANDPEGDAVRFEILSYPKKGTLTLSGSEYQYTAFENSTGNDSFSVVAIDRYGNRSVESEISVTVMERESSLTYSDMQGHAAHSAALTLSYCGALSGTVIGGEAVFYPDAEITSCEFIAALVTALSLDTQNANTAVFSDTDSIPPHLLPALGTAVNKGWVAINETFSPSKPITRAQAGKILCSALEINLDPIPGLTLGEQALLVLASRGIMPLADGALAVDHPVTRADAAMAICRVLDCI